jgi:hypothetical protein
MRKGEKRVSIFVIVAQHNVSLESAARDIRASPK